MSYEFIAEHDAAAAPDESIRAWYTKKDKSHYRKDWRELFHMADAGLREGLIPTPDVAVAALPPYSAVLSLAFRLEKPYISKDNSDFDILDNPLRKEWVFKTPEVASTSWKGALRATIRRLGHGDDDPVVVRLFGAALDATAEADVPTATAPDEQGAANAGQEANDIGNAGALTFFPTFFAPGDTVLEMINPHDRESGKGKNPIHLECVRAGAMGQLTVLYLPPPGAAPACLAEDLPLLAEGVIAMLTVYGFGAKTSSGYGVARLGQGKLEVNAQLTPTAAAPTQTGDAQPGLPRYLAAPGVLAIELRAADGSLVSERVYQSRLESSGKKYKPKDVQLYEKAKRWWEAQGQLSAEAAVPAAETTPPAPSWLFLNKDELRHAATDVAAQIMSGGDAQ